MGRVGWSAAFCAEDQQSDEPVSLALPSLTGLLWVAIERVAGVYLRNLCRPPDVGEGEKGARLLSAFQFPSWYNFTSAPLAINGVLPAFQFPSWYNLPPG